MKRAGLREHTDMVVLTLMDRSGWVRVEDVAKETGLPTSRVTDACRFLAAEYAVVEFREGGRTRGGSVVHVIHAQARLVEERLDAYEAGNRHCRPGRLHHPDHAWHTER